MGRKGAAARFRELGSELRRCRERAGLSGQVVAERTGWDKSKISRVESGHQQLTDVDVIHYLGACGVYLGTAGEYMDLCRDAHRYRDYWLGPHGAQLEHTRDSLIYHECTASTSFSYEPVVVPGLLQTSEYARAMMAPWRSAAEVEYFVEVRRQRQQILHLPRPGKFAFFLCEDVLTRQVGSSALMRDQLLMIVLLAALDHLEFRVVPSAIGALGELGGAFRVLEFDDHQPLVYLDTYTSGLFLEAPAYVEPYRRLVPKLRDASLDEGQSREFVANLANEFDRRSAGEHAHINLEEKQL